jgi:hypothetical protein
VYDITQTNLCTNIISNAARNTLNYSPGSKRVANRRRLFSFTCLGVVTRRRLRSRQVEFITRVREKTCVRRQRGSPENRIESSRRRERRGDDEVRERESERKAVVVEGKRRFRRRTDKRTRERQKGEGTRRDSWTTGVGF